MSWNQPTLGEFSEVVTLFSPAPALPDGQGGLLPGAPVEVATVWAQVDPRSGQEILAGNGLVATQPMRFRLHYREDVDETWLLDWRGRRLQVSGPPVPEGQSRRQWLVVAAIGGPA